MPVDLKTLSAHLGLSPTTVSRALNGYPEVKVETRDKVLKAAAEMGYQPNRAARQIALGRSDAIGILHTTGPGALADVRFFEVMEGLSDHLERRNVDLLIVPARADTELAVYERLIRGRRVDAFIVSRTQVVDRRIELLQQHEMPFVAYGRTGDCDHIPWLDFDNEAGMAAATRRLLDLGHRRLAYIRAPQALNFALQRWQGFVGELSAVGLGLDAVRVIEADLNRQDGYRAAQELLSEDPRPTAVLVDNYLSGLGAVRALVDHGIRLGTEMSILVYDFSAQDSLLQGLTIASVDQPTFYDTGWRLGEMVMELIKKSSIQNRQVLLQPQLFDGNSIGSPIGL